MKKQAQPLTPVQEDSLWDQGIFGLQSADSNAVFWYNCKCFGLRGGDEHRTLVAEQYSLDSDDCGRYLRFVGRTTKGDYSTENCRTRISVCTATPTLEPDVLSISSLNISLWSHHLAYSIAAPSRIPTPPPQILQAGPGA